MFRVLVTLLVLLPLVLIGVLIGADNSQQVQLVLLNWQSPHLPLIAWLILAAATGFAIALLLVFGIALRAYGAFYRAQRELKETRRQMRQLRQLSPRGQLITLAARRRVTA